MTTVPPPLPLPAPPGGGAAVVATVVAPPPPALTRLAPGSLIEGLIAQLPHRGTAVVETALGPLTLRLPFAIAPGATLTLQLTASRTALPQFRITALREPAPAPPPHTAAPGASAATMAPPSAAPTPVPAPPTAMVATLLRAATPGLPEGARFATAPPMAVPPSATAAGAPAPGAAAPAPGPVAPAVVAPRGPGGPPQLGTTPAGLTAPEAPPPRPGALVVPQPPAPLPATTIAPVAPAGAPPATALTAALTELLSALPAKDSPAAQALGTVLPRPGPQLIAQTLVYLAALRAGAAVAWLGEAPLAALERGGRRDLATRVKTALAETATTARHPDAQGWQVLTVPLMAGLVVEPIRLSLRRPPRDDADEEDGAATEPGTRFMLDLTLSRLGRLQLDGLVRRRARRFDLIIRTAAALPEGMRGDIGAIFARACDGLGIAGTASFQATPQFVEVAEAAAAHIGLLA